MSDHHRTGATIAGSYAEDVDEGRTDIVRKILIELVGINPADVVSLDDRVEIAHPVRLSANHRDWFTTTVHDRTARPWTIGTAALRVRGPAQRLTRVLARASR